MPDLQTIAVHKRGDLRAFLRLPWSIYSGDPNWVPPLLRDQRRTLDPGRHPFWQDHDRQLFLVRRGKEPLGRIAAIAPTDQEGQTGYFGYLEAVHDQAVFDRLFSAAVEWLRRQGYRRLIGPFNPGINYELGLLSEGFELPPYIMTTHNPAYYPSCLEAYGLRLAKEFLAYRVPTATLAVPEPLARAARFAEERYKLRVRSSRMEAYQEELAMLGRLYNAAFADHWGFDPMNAEEIRAMGDALRLIIDPDLVLFAEYGPHTIGFLLAVPNIHELLRHNRSGRTFPDAAWRLFWGRRRIGSYRLMAIGVLPEYRHLGVSALLYRELIRRTLARPNYREVELSWIMNSNRAVQRAARMFMDVEAKRYRVYELDLEDGRAGPGI